MRENVRVEECETTTHLIKIPVFTYASGVTKFSFPFFKPELRKHSGVRNSSSDSHYTVIRSISVGLRSRQRFLRVQKL